MRLSVLLLILSITSVCIAQTLTKSNIKRLDYRFIPIISKKTLSKTNITAYPQLKIAEKLSNGIEKFGAIIYTNEPDALRATGIKVNSVLPNFVTSRVTADDLIKLLNIESVKYIRANDENYPTNDVASGLIGADLLNSGYINSTPYKGSGVIIGIIDTGIDWNHEDFRDPVDPTKSRILYIWDQTITPSGGEINPAGYTYGVEYTKTNIEDEIDGSPAGFVREHDTNGHGTHVAGSAAGNGAALSTKKYCGMAPEADIIIVKAGNGSFPTDNIIDALSYIKNKAASLGKPVVVNMSLGSNYGAHDDTDPKTAAINDFCGAGSAVVVSAGNDGGSPIHTSGTIPAFGSTDITLTVPTYTPAAGASNDDIGFDIWLEDNSNVTLDVISPNSITSEQTAGSSRYCTTNDGSLILSNEVDLSNGDREFLTYIYDSLDTKTPAQGTWTIRLTNNTSSSKTYHGWLYDAAIGSASVSLTGGNHDYTLGNTASKAVIVGSYVSRWRWYASNGGTYSYTGSDLSDNISAFSSIGPTRDGRSKPDITAPGQAIVSARSSYASPAAANLIPGEKYFTSQGTSMSSPVTAGAVALLLQQNHSLSAADIKTLITSTANTDTYTGGIPNTTWGYGKLDIFKAMVKTINPGYDMDRKILAYDEWNSIGAVNIPPNTKIAVKFTPSFTGKVSGSLFHLSGSNGITSPIYAEVWNDNSGVPGSKLGNTVSFDQNKIAIYSWNYIYMGDANVNVTSGSNYYLVLYFTSGTDTPFLFENISVDNRSFINSGAGWNLYTNDFRIRTIVTKDISALPIELASFSYSAGYNQITLNWITATEINSYKFEIERKQNSTGNNDANIWLKIGEVLAQGNSNSPQKYSYINKDLPYGNYSYRLKMIDNNGNYEFSEILNCNSFVSNKPTLFQNNPNPFNPVTTINYQTSAYGHVQLKVYDMLGREIIKLVDQDQPAGNYSVKFDGGNLSNGVYLYSLETGSFSAAKKLILMK